MVGATTKRWRMQELVRLSRKLQTKCDLDGDSRRVRWRPNERLVRYYTTLGLLDRPAEMRGRTAFYGPRHILQLLAIKGLQAEGRDLKEIQQLLAGLPNQKLERIAGLPSGWEGSLATEERAEPETDAPSMNESRFWERRPARAQWTPPLSGGGPRMLQAVEISPGVTLMLDSSAYQGLDPGEIATAAENLIGYLQDHRKREREA